MIGQERVRTAARDRGKAAEARHDAMQQHPCHRTSLNASPTPAGRQFVTERASSGRYRAASEPSLPGKAKGRA